MRKAHVLAALLLAATLSFSCLGIAIAAEEEKAAAVETEAKVYADLEVTTKRFYNLRYADLGGYPVIKGYDDLNAKILKDLETAFALATDKSFTDTANVFSVKYEVKNDGQFAKIDVTYKYELTAGKMLPYLEIRMYYVDKELGKEITADAYKEGIEAAAEEKKEADVVEDENVNEIIMVPIRLYAVPLGYAVSWDGATKSVILTKDNARFTVTVGLNEYLVDNKIVSLESAPVNQSDSVYVPVSFFTKVLGASYSIDVNGNIVIE